jgi:PIN domain nuclease of toxin-antitoxin system
VTYLLDTRLLLWTVYQSRSLPARAIAIIEDDANALAFSVVGLWEVVIKSALGRAAFTYDSRALQRALLDVGYAELPITAAHALAVSELPPLHSDPFDRLIVAQARAEGMRLLTADRILAGYGNWVEVVS